MNDRATLWARGGLGWLFLTMLAGLQIGLAGEFNAASHHAHMGLLGGLWALAFAWLFERKGAALTTGGKVQWALYNLGLATMAVAMYLVVRQDTAWGAVIGLGGITVILTGAWIIYDVWPRKR